MPVHCHHTHTRMHIHQNTYGLTHMLHRDVLEQTLLSRVETINAHTANRHWSLLSGASLLVSPCMVSSLICQVLLGYHLSPLHCKCDSLCQWGITNLEHLLGISFDTLYNQRWKIKAVTHLAVISLLYLLVTTHIVTAPVFAETHWNIHLHVQLFPCHPAR